MPRYASKMDLQEAMLASPPSRVRAAGSTTEFGVVAQDKKSVSFYCDVSAYEHLHLNDCSEEEIALSWYTREDFVRIKAECLHTVGLLMKAGTTILEEDSMFCSRGLEYRTRVGAQMRQEHKIAAWDAVEDEQDRQWREGTVLDSKRLAQVYSGCCTDHDCARVAHLLAMSDEQYVLDFQAHRSSCLGQEQQCNKADAQNWKSKHHQHHHAHDRRRCILATKLHRGAKAYRYLEQSNQNKVHPAGGAGIAGLNAAIRSLGAAGA